MTNSARRPAALLLVLTLAAAACSAQAPPVGRSVPAVRSLAESQPTPVVRAPFALDGSLWVDAALGDLRIFDPAAGTMERMPPAADALVAQPALTPDCATSAWLVAAPGADRYGVAVDGVAVLSVTANLSFADVALSPDGREIFATRIVSSAGGIETEIVRLRLGAQGEPQRVVADAAQPSVAPNGRRMAYVALDAANPPEVVQQLRVRALDGAADFPVLEDGRFFEIYGPRWLDDEHLVFAALEQTPVVGSVLLDALLGRSSAHARAPAHARAGDVWVVAADGTGLRRLTAQALEAPILAPSPDGRHVALLADDALHVIQVDQAAPAEPQKIADVGGSGGLAWCRKP